MKSILSVPGLAPFACTALFVLGFAGAAGAQDATHGDWGPIFKDEHGSEAVTEPAEKYEDKRWLALQFRAFTGLRSRIAVLPMTCTHGDAPVDKISSLLETSLVHSNRFVVLTRADLSSVLGEQGNGNTGLFTKPTAPQMGKLLGAQFVVTTNIEEWIPEADKMSADYRQSDQYKEGGARFEKATSIVVMTVKVLDTTTGQIAFSETVNGAASSSRWSFKGLIQKYLPDQLKGLDFGTDHQAPITEALVVAINRAVYRITTGLRDKPWQGLVADADAEQIYIDGGTTVGITEGLEFNIYSRLGEITSPTTGQFIGYKMKPNGAVRITGADENMAYAAVIRGCKGVKKGDIVRIPGAVGAQLNTQAAQVAVH